MILEIGNDRRVGWGLRERKTYPTNHPLAPTALAHQVSCAWDVSTYSTNVLSWAVTSDFAVGNSNDNTISFSIGSGVVVR